MAEPESKRARTEPGEPASTSGVDEESYAVRSADGVVLHWARQAAERAGTAEKLLRADGLFYVVSLCERVYALPPPPPPTVVRA